MLSRSDLLNQLNALADDTRLHIIELVSGEGELRAQEIIARLGLSQSSASRHLRQLTATGYLIERRGEAGKIYSLNRDRIEDTLDAVRQSLQ
jgi:ArsR family transcriptional regulator